jgi:cytochrome P450
MLLLNPIGRRPDVAGFPFAHGAFPVLGHLPAMASDTLGFLRHAEREHGRAFFIDQGFGARALVWTHPEAFSIYKSKLASSAYMRDAGGSMFGESVIVQDGKVHQRMRAVLNGPFTPRGLGAAEVGTLIASVVSERVQALRLDAPLPILSWTRELALDVIFRVIGVGDRDLSEWRKGYQDALLLLVNLPLDVPGSPRRRGTRGKTWVDDRLRKLIAEERARPPQNNLLSGFVHGRGEAGETLSDDELVDNLRLLMLAGHETSASTMAWMVGLMAEHPASWRRLVEEASALGKIPTTVAELRQMPYAESIFREALRLYPPVAFDARSIEGELELEGRAVPPGTRVGIPLMHLSRHPEREKNPDAFVPDRWLDRSALGPLELMQFGGGPHFCLGYHLAWMEIVQFATALALHMGERKCAPQLVGKPASPRYLPLLHPKSSLRVAFR